MRKPEAEGTPSGKIKFNPYQWVLFLSVMGLVAYSIVFSLNTGTELSGPDQTGEETEGPFPVPQVPDPTPVPPTEKSDGAAPTPEPAADVDSTAGDAAHSSPAAQNRDVPQSESEDGFAKDWYFQSVIGDIVELYFGDGSGRDVQVGKPFDTPDGERATVVEIGPDRQTVTVGRLSDGRRFPVRRRVVIDLTTIEPSLVEAFHFSVHGLDPERLAEGVAEPVIDGRKPERYFFAHAASRIVFNLPGGFSRFRAIGFLGGRGGRVRFIVKADGADVFSSQPVRGPGSVDINATLPGSTKTLELIVDPMGSHGADHSFWIEPVLER